MKKILACAALALAAFGAHADPVNLIVNGDFSAGNSGFQSQYSYGLPRSGDQIPLWNPNFYGIGSNPFDFHPAWASLSGNDGNMLIANGGADKTQAFWSEKIQGLGTGSYTFSFSATGIYGGNPAVLNAIAEIFNADGTRTDIDLGTLTLTGTPGEWLTLSTSFDLSGGGTRLRLMDLNGNADGNDFAIDNISLVSNVPEPQSLALMFAGLAAAGFVTRRRKQK